MSARKISQRNSLRVDIALQGGGAHGAFSWGALDRLLEEPWLQIEGISGTSAGAMNAAVLAHGYAAGGAAGARAALETFWRKVSEAARFSPFQRGPLDVLLGRWTLDHSPVFVAMDMMARVFSPYDLNPGGTNPLRAILAETDRFRTPPGRPDQAVRDRNECPHRPRPRVPQRRVEPGRAAGFRMPADDVSGGRDRW